MLISWKIAWFFRINPPGKKPNRYVYKLKHMFPSFQGDLEMLKLLMGIATFQMYPLWIT